MESSGKITQAKQAISQTAREAAAKVKTVAADTAAKARGEAERLVGEKKETAADRIGGYSSAIHDSAKSLEESDPNIAWFTHQAADKLQSVADYVRSRDFAGLKDDCCGVARRHPAAFFGGMFVAGLLIGNLMKASARPREETDSSFDFDDADWRRRQNEDYSTTSPQEDLPMSSSPLPSTSPSI